MNVFVEAFDDELIKYTLSQLKKGRTVETPVYDFKTYSRLCIIIFLSIYSL